MFRPSTENFEGWLRGFVFGFGFGVRFRGLGFCFASGLYVVCIRWCYTCSVVAGIDIYCAHPDVVYRTM